ncbi:hypothetical protein BST63_01820 [Bradyrhizobium canariense]|uniref:Cell division protein FtsA n=1 Tax=Bradyrhizobium canariense TaxID=255045 RepID=A0ABX3XC37_9BRAD|nr:MULTISPECIES: hypothetical protein [Bradyrhizobium]OSI76524.1 hypothetical protein BSZ21_04085 [Bradyrhizobium canariense]OSJ19628.1 hypothetical protein BSR47_01945 [Bradyrhizobium canariense]OSJ35474.1 hypothetical protein BST63_01820 [Bradyrhizobium canariense]WOH60198.1 hypothetical protein RX329_08840 [Bradyrhizobium sp. BWC-3-1]WOH61743.1 hypothetical protein RX329_17275 [Bradyrhizobium sp. BWC-3-1]
MAYSKPFDIAVIGAGATKLSVVALDLENAEEACAVGKRMAETTGRTVTVRNAEGEVLGIFPGANEN